MGHERTAGRRRAARLLGTMLVVLVVAVLHPAVPASADNGVTVTANNPPRAIAPTTAQPISSIVFREEAAGVLAVGTTVCVELHAPSGVTFTPSAPDVGVVATGGAGTTDVTTSSTVASFTVTTPSVSSPVTYTLTGLELDADPSARGLVHAHAGVLDPATGTCGSDYVRDVVVSAVIGRDRFAGADRYETAASIFTSGAGCTATTGTPATTAVLARGDAFPDALAGAFLAGVNGTRILLTRPDSLPPATAAALTSSNVRTVYVLGGVQAVDDAVLDELRALSVTSCDGTTGVIQEVVRIAGATRADTAAAVARQVGAGAVAALPEGKAAIVTTGATFPDALAAGPLAAHGFPILLATRDALGAATAGALGDLGIRRVLLVGGAAAVGPAVEDELAARGLSVLRIAGADRTETAVAVASFESDLGWVEQRVALARGDDFADALAGGPHAGAASAPLLLARTPADLGATTSGFLRGLASSHGTTDLDLFGGNAAVTPATEESAANALTGAVPTVGPIGFDISWPQCTRSYPAGAAFGIVGVNGGKPFTPNPCLASEFAWASAAPAPPAVYLNTNNPSTGPEWVLPGPRPCSGGPDDLGCAYDYGWNFANWAVDHAVNVTGAVPRMYWLDVETKNTWSANKAANTTVVRAAVDALRSRPDVVAAVGIYATKYQWGVVTGGSTGFGGYPNWVPGAPSAAAASDWCARSATGGPVVMVQFPSNGYDGDAPCR